MYFCRMTFVDRLSLEIWALLGWKDIRIMRKRALSNTLPVLELGNCLYGLSNTRPYRAPELIFAPNVYGGEIEKWAFGCTVAELYTQTPPLCSDGAEDGGWSSDLVLLNSINTILGTPTSETWPESKPLEVVSHVS